MNNIQPSIPQRGTSVGRDDWLYKGASFGVNNAGLCVGSSSTTRSGIALPVFPSSYYFVCTILITIQFHFINNILLPSDTHFIVPI